MGDPSSGCRRSRPCAAGLPELPRPAVVPFYEPVEPNERERPEPPKPPVTYSCMS